MLALIEPLPGGSAPPYFEKLGALSAAGAAYTEAIVFNSEPAGRPQAACWLFDAEERIVAALPNAASGTRDRRRPA